MTELEWGNLSAALRLLDCNQANLTELGTLASHALAGHKPSSISVTNGERLQWLIVRMDLGTFRLLLKPVVKG